MQLFPVDLKSPRCFRKKDILKTNKLIKDLFRWTPPSSPASTDGEQDTKKSLTEPRAELRPQPRRWSNKPFTKKKYWSYDPHRSRDSVSPVCGIFILNNSNTELPGAVGGTVNDTRCRWGHSKGYPGGRQGQQFEGRGVQN